MAGHLGSEEEFFQRYGDIFGKTNSDKSSGGNGISVANQPHGIGSRDDFFALRRTAGIDDRVSLQ
jgi:hypothetical protein